jgi:hypothetical protein
MRARIHLTMLCGASLAAGCVGGNGQQAAATDPPPLQNVVSLSVDSGPSGLQAINHAYVTVKVCAAGSQSACASIDHVLLDTGSYGLRLVRSVLTARGVTLTAETDAQGSTIEECMSFNGGQTWGPVALADVTLAGESALKLPVQVMDDTSAGAPPPASCGANGTLINGVTGFNANGVFGVGVLITDCGQACVSPTTPLPIYYGCTASGACTPENVALAQQVSNPVAMFGADNNGVIVNLPNLVNANGDASVTGELIFGIATQSDNQLPMTGLTMLGANGSGNFNTAYNGSSTPLAALIDSGTDSYVFSDASIPVCSAGAFVGYYCPSVAPQSASAVNSGLGSLNATGTVNFAIADPNTFVANAAALIDLAGGAGATGFTWGMPFFYGRSVYFGFEQRVSSGFSGPYYAY